MKIILLVIMILATLNSFGQEKKEIWYTWIDTRVEMGGEEVRLISNQLMELTCCVSSSKYRKFTSKTTQWIEKELKLTLGEESPFAKTQDKDLAEKILGDALKKAGEDSNIRILDYHAKCK